MTLNRKVIYLIQMAKPKSIPKETPKENKAEFKVVVKMNDQEFSAETNDLATFVASLRPSFLKTKVIIVVEKNNKRAERMLLGFKARQLFRSPIFLRTFLSKLTFK